MAIRVLVVEDEVDGGDVVAGILGQHDILTDIAITAEDALQLLEGNQYDAAVIDLALPGMSGFDLVQRIRQHERYAALPCIAYTAYHSSKVRYEAKESGFDAYLEKPLDRKLLITTLHELLDL